MLLADTTGQCEWEFSSAGRASALQAGCHRFEPCNSHHFLNNVLKYDAGVAQLVEQLICNQQVGGSSPSTSSTVLIYGEVPEWPKGADCKSVVSDFDGSNPSLPTKSAKAMLSRIFVFSYNFTKE